MRCRVLLYSHDSYGLGHLRRSLLLAGGIVARSDVDDVLVVTGSPRPGAFPLPARVDTVKLPAVTKDDSGAYRPRTLGLPFAETVKLRSQIIDITVEAFRPDMIIVDHTPVGLGGELLPVLERIADGPTRPRMVLGLRDIIDAPERVEDQWLRSGAWPALESVYDAVLVYGDSKVATTAMELDLTSRVGCPVEHVGYLSRSMPERRPDDGTLPTVLVTVGGGGDGHHVLRAYAEFLAEVGPAAPFRSVVVTGPLLSSKRRAEISAALRLSGAPVEVVSMSYEHEELLANASAVIAMAGYNTTCEILTAGVPALLVPREAPRVEQLLRAQRLAAIGAVEYATSATLTPSVVAAFVDRALATGRRVSPITLRMDGVAQTVGRVASICAVPPRTAGRASRWGPADVAAGGGRVGYVLKKFPRLSETFILNELLGLEQLGLDIDVLSLQPADDEPRHAALSELRARVAEVAGNRTATMEQLLARLGDEAGAEAVGRAEALLARLPAGRERRVLARGMAIADTVRERGIVHLHAHFLTVAAHTAYIAHLATGVPFTVTAHAKDVYRHGVDPWIFSEISAAAQAVITVCEANREYIVERLVDDRARVEVIHNGLPLGALPAMDAVRDPRLVLGVGRLVEKKGFDELIAACARLRDIGRPFRCVIVGEGDRRAALEEQIRAESLSGLVQLRGSGPERRGTRADGQGPGLGRTLPDR